MMKTYTDEALARAVYGIAAERMAQAGAEMPCSENVFAVLTAAKPDAVQYKEIAALSNADFLEAAYYLLLRRPLDAPSRTDWQSKLSLPETAFHTLVLKTVLHSAEYQLHRIPLTGCPLPLAEENGQNLIIAAQAMPERLVKMYQKMPRPMQKLAKKLAGKE